MTAGPAQWQTSSGGPDGAYYSFNVIKVTGGGTLAAPWNATLIAGGTAQTGVVDISGNPVINPFFNDFLIVSGQVKLAGTPVLKGVVFATATASGVPTSSVGDDSIAGNVQLTGNVITPGNVNVTGAGGGKIIYNVGTRTRFLSPTLRILSWSTGSH